jgi:hypothetical protein
VAQAVEDLPSKFRALTSILSTAKKKPKNKYRFVGWRCGLSVEHLPSKCAVHTPVPKRTVALCDGASPLPVPHVKTSHIQAPPTLAGPEFLGLGPSPDDCGGPRLTSSEHLWENTCAYHMS